MRDEHLTLMDGTKVKRDKVLGVITISTIPETPVSGSLLKKEWSKEGLDPKLIPDVRKAADTFAQACRSVETRRANGTNGQQVEVKVDEVSNGPDERIYQITRMVRDQAKQVIDHPKAMKIVLDKAAAEAGAKAADCIDVQPLDKATFGVLKGLADKVLAYFDKNRTTVPGQKIRNAVRDYFHILGAENMRRNSGGVYFVPTSGVDTLESLQRVVEALYGGAADLHFWPQLNTKGAQDAVGKHHAINVVNECDEMIATITERLKKKGKVRKDLLTNLMQRRRELGARRKQYVEILGGEQQALAAHFETLDDQIDKLMEQAV